MSVNTALFPGGLGSLASHWPAQTVAVSNRLVFSSTWTAKNGGALDAKVYMEVEVIRPMFPSPQRLVATLPGQNNFTTEMTRSLILFTLTPVYTAMAGQSVTVTGQVQIAAAALPKGVKLDLRIRLRRVDNPSESSDPTKVGPVITNGEHKQDAVVMVLAEAQLQAVGNPDMQAFT